MPYLSPYKAKPVMKRVMMNHQISSSDSEDYDTSIYNPLGTPNSDSTIIPSQNIKRTRRIQISQSSEEEMA